MVELDSLTTNRQDEPFHCNLLSKQDKFSMSSCVLCMHMREVKVKL
jgi:hypothetical protein